MKTSNTYFRLLPILILAIIITLSVSLLIKASQSLKVPLLQSSDWINSDDFLVTSPDRINSYISDGLITKEAKLFVNQKAPVWETFSGRLESKPFLPSHHMVIPIRGLVYSKGVYARQFNPEGGSINLRCLGNNKLINLLTSPSQDWFERQVTLPNNWCYGEVKIELEVSDSDVYIGVGTPFKVDATYSIVAGSANLFVAFGVASLIFLAIFIPPLLITSISYLERGAIALLNIGFFGYVSFVLQAINFSKNISLPLSILMFIGPTIIFFIAFYRGMAPRALEQLTKISIAWLILGFFIVVPISIMPVNSGAWNFNFAFYPVAWSTDNLLPTGMAVYVLETLQIQHPGLLPWSVVDRGFVPAGLIAGGLYLLDQIHIFHNIPNVYAIAQMFISLANASILLLALQFPRFNNICSWDIFKISLIFCATPFFFFNAVYSWPKIAAGAFIVWGILLISSSSNNRTRLFLYSPLLILFGILFHSATLFLVPFILFYIFIKAWIYLKSDNSKHHKHNLFVPISICLFALSLFIYHESYGDKTSFGISFVLTGSGIFGLTKQQLIELLHSHYNKMTLEAFFALKWQQFTTLLWPTFKEIYYEKDILSQLRIAQLHSAIPSILVFTPIVMLCKKFWIKGGASVEGVRGISTSLMISALTVFIMLMLSGLPFIVAHLPYSFFISALLFVVLVADYKSKTVNALIAIHTFTFFVVWIMGPWWFWTHRNFSPS